MILHRPDIGARHALSVLTLQEKLLSRAVLIFNLLLELYLSVENIIPKAAVSATSISSHYYSHQLAARISGQYQYGLTDRPRH